MRRWPSHTEKRPGYGGADPGKVCYTGSLGTWWVALAMSQIIKVAGCTNELRASVVFIHGLGGHAYDTWRRGFDDKSFWPLWLSQDIEGIAVYTLNYPAPLSNW